MIKPLTTFTPNESFIRFCEKPLDNLQSSHTPDSKSIACPSSSHRFSLQDGRQLYPSVHNVPLLYLGSLGLGTKDHFSDESFRMSSTLISRGGPF